MEGSSSDKITASHTASRDVACEPSVLPTVHDSEDDFIEDSVNSNTEGDMLEEHCSDLTDAAIAPLEVDSDLHQDPASAPSIGIDGDHQDVSSTNVQQTQQELPEEHDHMNSDSPQLGDITSVPPVGSSDGIAHSDTDLHRYPR